jgi:hypothetical protein
MPNDTDLIYEAYTEIYSEAWKDIVAAALMTLGAATGSVVGIKHAATEYSQGLPSLKTPQVSDSSTVDTYLGKMAKIAGLDLSKATDENKLELRKNLKRHYQALEVIKNNGSDLQKKQAAHIMNTMQNVAGKKYNISSL